MSALSRELYCRPNAWSMGRRHPPFEAARPARNLCSDPLTSLTDDVASLNRALERTTGPIVLVGPAYGGAVTGAIHDERVKPFMLRCWYPMKAIPEEVGISRFGKPDEIADLLSFLVSPAAK